MPSIRIGYGSDFSASGANVGIGTTVANAKLQVSGAARANFNIAGVTTLTAYSGFVAEKQNIFAGSKIGFNTVGLGTGLHVDTVTSNIIGFATLTQYYETESEYTKLENFTSSSILEYKSLSGDLIVDDGKIFSIQDTEMVGFTTLGEYSPHTHKSSVCLGSLENLSVRNHFSVPCGEINDRQNNAIEGSVRFNDDLNTLEFFNGNEWKQFTYNQGQSGRAIWGGGATPAKNKTIDYVQFNTLGNAVDFGDLDVARELNAGASSSIRGLFPGGENSPYTAQIDYITIASEGNGIDFGDLSQARLLRGGCSSSSRGLFAGGRTPTAVDTIDFVEISTLGTALDFGDTVFAGPWGTGFASPFRGVWAGGGPAPSQTDIIEYNTIASKGDAIDYGDLGQKKQSVGGCANSIRGVIASGYIAPSNGNTNAIEFITISTGGSAEYFGSLTDSRRTMEGAASQIRGIFGGGEPSVRTDMDYVTIASTGDAIDFGDLTVARASCGTVSDSHGGLGGF